MSAICSIEAGRLSPEDKAAYAKKKTVAQKRAFVEGRLAEAQQAHMGLVSQVQAAFPNLVTDDGIFIEDLRAAEIEAAEAEAAAKQTSLLEREGDAKADTTKKKVAKAKEKIDAKAKTRRAKPSPAKVAGGKQPASVSKAAAGAAKLGAAAAKGKTKKAVSNPAGGKQATNPKAAESKPVGGKKPQPVKRQGQQPVDLAKRETLTKPQRVATSIDELAVDLAKRDLAKRETLTKPQRVATAIDELETLTGAARDDAVLDILTVALYEPKGKGADAVAHQLAQDVLNDTGDGKGLLWGSNRNQTIEIALELIEDMEIMGGKESKTPPSFVYQTSAQKGQVRRPWAFALANDFLPQAYNAVLRRIKTAPTNPTGEIQAALGVEEVVAPIGIDDAPRAAVESIMAMFDGILERMDTGAGTDPARIKLLNTRLVKLLQTKGVDLETRYRGFPLYSWLSPNRQFRWKGDGFISTPNGFQSTEGILNSWLSPTSRANIFDLSGRPIVKPMSLGNVKLAASRIMGKFRTSLRMRHRVYKNVAEFKRKRPELYKQAVDAHETKRPIPENAAGYAFGDMILLFSDNIASRQQLAFTISHEAIGHLGLGSLMTRQEFHKMLDDIYRADTTVRRDADILTTTRELPHYEAIEEVLADRAAELDNSTLKKIAAAIKRFFNAIGFKFNDDMTRYFTYHSRRYARTGKVGDVSPLGVFRSLSDLDRRNVSGRASVASSTFHDITKDQTKGKGNPLGSRTLAERVEAVIRRASTAQGAKDVVRVAWGKVKELSEMIQTMDNLSMYSEGLHALYTAFARQAATVQHLKTKYINGTEFSRKVRTLFNRGEEIPSKEDLSQANRAAEMWLAAKEGISEDAIEAAPSLTKVDANGKIVLDRLGGIATAIKAGAMKREEIDAGIDMQIIGDDGKPTGKTWKYKLDSKLSDNAWRILEEGRVVINEAALDVLINNITGITNNQKHIRDRLAIKYAAITDTDLEIIDEITAVYGRLLEQKSIKGQPTAKDTAKAFLYQVTRVMDSQFSNQKLKDWKDGPKDKRDARIKDFVLSTDGDVQSVIAKLPLLGKGKQGAGIDGAHVQRVIADIHGMSAELVRADNAAKRTLMTAYVPLDRRGKYQVRVQAKDKQGNPIRLADTLQAGLIYSRTDHPNEAAAQVKALDELLSGRVSGELLDTDGSMQDGVTFEALYETAIDAPPMAGVISYGEIYHTLLRAGIQMDAKDREKLITLMSTQNSSARHGLQREGVPGWDPDIQRGIREHLERQANIAAKNLYQHEVADTVTSSKKLWNGDPAKLKRLQDDFRAVFGKGSDAAIFEAKREMDTYQRRFVEAAATKAGPWIPFLRVDRKGNLIEEKVNGRNKANHYLKIASDMVRKYSEAAGMPAVTGDEKAGQFAGIAIGTTAAMQLGGALAPAMINTTSLLTHAVPYIATYNWKTGYGGGHGMQAALREIFRAGSDLSLLKDGFSDLTGSSKTIKAIIDGGEKSLARYGLTKDEAAMLLDKTDKGKLTPSLINVLTGAGSFGKGSNAVVKGLEAWMKLFSKTEQYNRRVTALATYRLEKARMLEASGNTSLTEEQVADIYERVDRAVDASQGNYEKFNHPSIARGPLLKYLWVYKQFQAITIQLMSQLGHKERMAFLAFFIITSGLKGIPFEEDFADFIDTIMQKFNMNWKGLEGEISLVAEAFDIPAGVLMRGPIDHWLGITYSTRISQSNIIPGSGFFKAGADPWRETRDIIGPVLSAWSDIFTSVGTAGRYTLESVGLLDDVTSLKDVLRTGGGSSAMKNYMKGIIYALDGKITNQRGQLVSKEMDAMSVLFQFMGFYPAAATRQYDVNRITGDVADYTKVLNAAYSDAYIKADAVGRRNIERQVREWNRNVGRSSPLYLATFKNGLSKKLKASEKESSVGRNQKALPKQVKRFGKTIAAGRGLDTRGFPLN